MFVEKRKNDFMNPLAQGDCPVCGGNEFEWGRLGGQVGFYPSDGGYWRLAMPKVVMARRCLNCNNLLSFVDEEMTRQQRKLVILVVSGIVGAAVLITLLALALG